MSGSPPAPAAVVGALQALARQLGSGKGRGPGQRGPEIDDLVRLALRLLSSRLFAASDHRPPALAEPLPSLAARLHAAAPMVARPLLRLLVALSPYSSSSLAYSSSPISSSLSSYGQLPMEPRRQPLPRPAVAAAAPAAAPSVSRLERPPPAREVERAAAREDEALVRAAVHALHGLESAAVLRRGQALGPRAALFAPRCPPAEPLMRAICDVGGAYLALRQRLADDDRAASAALPLAQQSLRAALRAQLRHYAARVGALAARLDASPPSLRHVYGAARELGEGLALLADAERRCAGLRGGALCNALHRAQQATGDPQTRAVLRALLQAAAAPVLAMLSAWVLEGAPADPHGEFFVEQLPGVEPARLWAHGFRPRADMAPEWLGPALVQLALGAGRTVNFLRRCCVDHAWLHELAASPAAAALRVPSPALQYGAEAHLERELRGLAGKLDARAAAQLRQAGLARHLGRVHACLLLGDGDFAAALLAAFHDAGSGAGPAAQRHRLLAVLEQALRSCRAAQADPELAARLDVALLPARGGAPAEGAFVLTYAVDSPLSTVLGPAALARYGDLFRFLWRLKGIEAALTRAFRGHVRLSHALGARWGGVTLHAARLATHQMAQLVAHLLQRLQGEVLLPAHRALLRTLEEAATVDRVLELHEAFLAEASVAAQAAPEVLGPLEALLETMLHWTRLHADLLAAVEQRLERRQAVAARAAQRSARGGWGIDVDEEDEDDPLAPLALAPGAAEPLEAHLELYRARLAEFRAALAQSAGPLHAALDLVQPLSL